MNEAGRLRMQAWRYTQMAPHRTEVERSALAAAFDRSILLLRQGDPARPLFVPQDAATHASLEAVSRGWIELRSALEAGASADEASARAEALVGDIDRLVTSIESRLQRWTSLLSALQFTLLALALAAGVALLYATHLFIFQPLAQLQRGLEAMARGELGARVADGATDEFGDVARGFNRMAVQLEDLYRGLETKVAEKTDT